MADVLEGYKLHYEDMPRKKYKYNLLKRGAKMPKETATKKRPYAPTRVEVAKTVIIAVMIAAAIAFVAGVQYANGQNERIEQAVQALTVTQTVEASK